MTTEQTIVWTALPNGIRRADNLDFLYLSVFAAPRLKTDQGLPKPTLSQFPAFVDWPATLFPPPPATQLQFQVQFGDGQPIPNNQVTRQGDLPRSDLWQALFKPTTYVRPFEFGRLLDPYLKDLRLYDTKIPIRSYPVRSVLDFVKAQHVKAGTASPAELPSILSLAQGDAFGKIGFGGPAAAGGKQGAALGAALAAAGIPSAAAVANKELSLKQEIEQVILQMRAVPPGLPDPEKDFWQAKEYQAKQTPNAGALAAVAVPEVDFHQMLAMLNNYPKLLRLLGLVHDLMIPWPPNVPKQNQPVTTTVKVTVSWPGQAPSQGRACRTRCLIGAKTFSAAPRAQGPELSRGFLRLNDKSKYEVVPVDVDGAVARSLRLADSLLKAAPAVLKALQAKPADEEADEADDEPDLPTAQGLPPFRSAGLSVVRAGRALDLANRWAVALQRNTRLESQLEVVLDAEEVVRGYYVDIFDANSGKWLGLCKRHGIYQFVDAGVTLEADDEGAVTTGVTRAADGSTPDLFVHEALFRWAGWSLVAPRPGKTIKPDGSVDYVDNTAATAFHLETSFTATPGSLPRLRYGRTYRIRARAADLAGNSVPFGVSTSTDFSLAAGPITYARFEPVASPVVVLCSPRTEGESLERLVIRSNYHTAAAATMPAERHIAPPKVAQLLAEEHGMFDTPAGLNQLAYPIAGRESAALALDQPHLDIGAVPYLADPLARGAAWRGLPGTGAGSVFTKSDFAYTLQGWPEAQTFRLSLVEGTGAPVWDATARVLTVKLPKGEVARVRLSSYLSSADLELMGVWQWQKAAAGLTKQRIAELRDHGTSGSQWQLAPPRDLVFVHAVRQPLLAPKFNKLIAERRPGDTFVTLEDTMTASRKSTVRVDVAAEWTEPVDPLGEPTWRTITGRAQPFRLHVARPSETRTADLLKFQRRHEFGDTKYREVSYSAVATTRFAEYFRERQQITLTSGPGVPLTMAGIVPGSEVVRAASGTVYERGRDYRMDFQPGTIFLVPAAQGGRIPDGASLEVAYLEEPIARPTAATTKVDVLSTARPASPKVLYLLPTFGWQVPHATATGKVSKRTGGGLRVYLDRPWFSSGAGELLGVVLWPELWARGNEKSALGGGNVTVPDDLKRYVTQYGLDPIWRSRPVYRTPVLNDFKAATEKATGLTLDEAPGETVAVAGHPVAYDETRRLWYCDLEIDAGESYFPFVRLALARFQPKSLPGLHLSRVVLADFVQLAPDRTATVTYDAKNLKQVTVSVAGLSYSQSAAGIGPGPVTVTVQTRRSGVEGELGWVSGATPTTLSPTQGISLTPGSGATTLRTGTVPLPFARGSQPMRLLIQEYEKLPADGSFNLTTTAQRLVYADAIEI